MQRELTKLLMIQPFRQKSLNQLPPTALGRQIKPCKGAGIKLSVSVHDCQARFVSFTCERILSPTVITGQVVFINNSMFSFCMFAYLEKASGIVMLWVLCGEAELLLHSVRVKSWGDENRKPDCWLSHQPLWKAADSVHVWKRRGNWKSITFLLVFQSPALYVSAIQKIQRG